MSKRVLWIALGLVLPACPVPGAGGLGGGGTSGGENPSISAQCASANYGASAAQRKISTFLGASAEFVGAANQLQGSLVESCKAMGSALGMADSEMSGDVSGVCNSVASKLRSELTSLRGEASLQIQIVAAPPRCEVSVDAYAQCAAQCDATVDPGEVNVECEGGHISGTCSAECSGECSVEVSGQCSGSCEGTCSGGCSGTCQGACEGTCSATDAEGNCNGSCSGTCHGSCSAGCSGSCEGECWVSGQASCQGQCRGGCSVDYQEPRCSGTVRPPSVSADCNASCDARVSAQAECQPGEVEVTITGDIGADFQERVDRVRNALRTGWGQFLVTGRKIKDLARAGQALVDSIGNLRGVGRDVLEAAGCMAEAFGAVPAAFAQVNMSVSVQVSVSAEVSAGASG